MRTRYDELIKIYYDSLSQFVTKLGSDPKKLCPFDELEIQLKRFGLFGVIMAPVILQVLVADNITDLETVDGDRVNLATFSDTSMLTYIDRISDALQDAIRFDWVDL